MESTFDQVEIGLEEVEPTVESTEIEPVVAEQAFIPEHATQGEQKPRQTNQRKSKSKKRRR